MFTSVPARCALALVLIVLSSFSVAFAKCERSEVKALLAEGKTVGDVAEECGMSSAVVRYILEEDQGEGDAPVSGGGRRPPPGAGGRLPSGSPVGACGCWGYVDPNFTQAHPLCQSGSAKPQMCSAACPAGGFMWQGVCT